ncbi:MAG: hypothetical protein LBH81_01505 [Rickettsiales bacterium]|jgi:hypothetical protein|nr:hypothetical protein [Rickettsiales bacterium]
MADDRFIQNLGQLLEQHFNWENFNMVPRERLDRYKELKKQNRNGGKLYAWGFIPEKIPVPSYEVFELLYERLKTIMTGLRGMNEETPLQDPGLKALIGNDKWAEAFPTFKYPKTLAEEKSRNNIARILQDNHQAYNNKYYQLGMGYNARRLAGQIYSGAPLAADVLAEISEILKNMPKVDRFVNRTGEDLGAAAKAIDDYIGETTTHTRHQLDNFAEIYQGYMNNLYLAINEKNRSLIDKFDPELAGYIIRSKERKPEDIPMEPKDNLVGFDWAKAKVREVLDNRLLKRFDRHLSHRYRDPDAAEIMEQVMVLGDGFSPKDGLDGFIKALGDVNTKKNPNLSSYSTGAAEWMKSHLEDIKKEKPFVFAGALKNSQQMTELVSELIRKFALKEHIMGDKYPQIVLECLSVLAGSRLLSTRRDAFKQSDWGIMSGLPAFQSAPPLQFFAKAVDFGMNAAARAVFESTVLTKNLIFNRRKKLSKGNVEKGLEKDIAIGDTNLPPRSPEENKHLKEGLESAAFDWNAPDAELRAEFRKTQDAIDELKEALDKVLESRTAIEILKSRPQAEPGIFDDDDNGARAQLEKEIADEQKTEAMLSEAARAKKDDLGRTALGRAIDGLGDGELLKKLDGLVGSLEKSTELLIERQLRAKEIIETRKTIPEKKDASVSRLVNFWNSLISEESMRMSDRTNAKMLGSEMNAGTRGMLAQLGIEINEVASSYDNSIFRDRVETQKNFDAATFELRKMTVEANNEKLSEEERAKKVREMHAIYKQYMSKVA